jgi:NADPH-dependent glutamate synthase beta subunit-like oxidoreductase
MEAIIAQLPEAAEIGQAATGKRAKLPACGDRLPPCNRACPAGEQTQAWMYQAAEGHLRAAWDEIMRNNPFPAIMGRACYHTCESNCNRGLLDASVNVHAVERSLGDLAISEGWRVERIAAPSGKRVLVIGAGPAGLAAAYHLTLLGHAVTVMDGQPKPGGMMRYGIPRYGIPRYRLPRPVLEAEIQRIADLGVRFVANTRVENVRAAMAEEGAEACFLGFGAHDPRRVEIPGGNPERVLDAVSYLRSQEPPAVPPFPWDLA